MRGIASVAGSIATGQALRALPTLPGLVCCSAIRRCSRSGTRSPQRSMSKSLLELRHALRPIVGVSARQVLSAASQAGPTERAMPASAAGAGGARRARGFGQARPPAAFGACRCIRRSMQKCSVAASEYRSVQGPSGRSPAFARSARAAPSRAGSPHHAARLIADQRLAHGSLESSNMGNRRRIRMFPGATAACTRPAACKFGQRAEQALEPASQPLRRLAARACRGASRARSAPGNRA